MKSFKINNANEYSTGGPFALRVHNGGQSVPCDVQVVDNYSGQSYRLLALAGGVVQGVGKLNLAAMSQQQLEARAGSLDLLGLLVLSNHLRHDSRECIMHLQDRWLSYLMFHMLA